MNNFLIPSLRLYATNNSDGKAHCGTDVLIRNQLNHHALETQATAQLQAATIRLKNRSND